MFFFIKNDKSMFYNLGTHTIQLKTTIERQFLLFASSSIYILVKNLFLLLFYKIFSFHFFSFLFF